MQNPFVWISATTRVISICGDFKMYLLLDLVFGFFSLTKSFYHGLLPERQSHGHGASCFFKGTFQFWEVAWEQTRTNMSAKVCNWSRVVDFLTTFSQLSHNFLTTFSQISHNFLTTFSQFFHNFLTTFSKLSHNFLKTFSQLSLNFLTTFSQHSHSFLTTFKQLSHNFLTAFSQLSPNFLPTFSQLSHNFLTTFSQFSHHFITTLSQLSHNFLTIFSQFSHIFMVFMVCNFLDRHSIFWRGHGLCRFGPCFIGPAIICDCLRFEQAPNWNPRNHPKLLSQKS